MQEGVASRFALQVLSDVDDDLALQVVLWQNWLVLVKMALAC